jgi:Asp-tRNA(Asn)/Glu-tRNA(Gln) amidotransferase A subunit family amidase
MCVDGLAKGREDQLSPTLKDFLDIAHAEAPFGGDELLQAWAESDVARGQMLCEMKDYPVLLCPACAVPAFRPGERAWKVEGQTVKYLDVMRYAAWFNALGAPAAIVPVGQSPEGLPVGVQVAARPYEDEVALAIAGVIDREFGYRRPPLQEAR